MEGADVDLVLGKSMWTSASSTPCITFSRLPQPAVHVPALPLPCLTQLRPAPPSHLVTVAHRLHCRALAPLTPPPSLLLRWAMPPWPSAQSGTATASRPATPPTCAWQRAAAMPAPSAPSPASGGWARWGGRAGRGRARGSSKQREGESAGSWAPFAQRHALLHLGISCCPSKPPQYLPRLPKTALGIGPLHTSTAEDLLQIICFHA